MEGGLGSGFLGGVGIFSLGWDRVKFLFLDRLNFFQPGFAQNFSRKSD